MNEHITADILTPYFRKYVACMGTRYSSAFLKEQYDLCILEGVLPEVKTARLLDMKMLRTIFPPDFHLSDSFILGLEQGKKQDIITQSLLNITGLKMVLGFDRDLFYKEHLDEIKELFTNSP